MQILEHPPSAQLDPAEALGLLKPLPAIVPYGELRLGVQHEPEDVVVNLLHRGCKLILGGTSKSNKSWCLLDLAVSIANGKPWLGFGTKQGKVLFINFELQPWAIQRRLRDILFNRPDLKETDDNLHVWNLRGHNSDLTTLRPRLESQLEETDYSAIIIDPAYKVLGDRDENANGEIASLMNEFEALAQKSGAAIVIAHHFAKGDSSAKSAIDRMSGAGAWARDPDSILVMSPHEEENAFSVSVILRNHPPVDDFVVQWSFPLMSVATDLDPANLRTPQSKNKKCTDAEFLSCFTQTPSDRSEILRVAKEKFNLSESRVYALIGEQIKAGKLKEIGRKVYLA